MAIDLAHERCNGKARILIKTCREGKNGLKVKRMPKKLDARRTYPIEKGNKNVQFQGVPCLVLIILSDANPVLLGQKQVSKSSKDRLPNVLMRSSFDMRLALI